jgi:NAD(P)-dependent dehydrogenase (short-subunit alcohol dehydrogenase family)
MKNCTVAPPALIASDSMAVGDYVIVGYGGIAVGVLEQILQQTEVEKVVVLSRSAHTHTDVRVLFKQGDIGSPETLADVFKDISAPCCVINTIGFLHGEHFRPEKRLADVRKEALTHSITVNTYSTIALAQAIEHNFSRQQAVTLVALSARVGSIADNRLGGWLSYRVSKAALNMAIRTVSVEWRRTRPLNKIIAYHPGTVDTGLSQPFQASVPEDKLFSAVQAGQYLLDVITQLDTDDSGSFKAWDGSDIAW